MVPTFFLGLCDVIIEQLFLFCILLYVTYRLIFA